MSLKPKIKSYMLTFHFDMFYEDNPYLQVF